MFKRLFSPNGTPILHASDFQNGLFQPQRSTLAVRPDAFLKETAADYAAPIVGSAPPGLGFTFGDSWRRTNRGTMDFNLPFGQVSTINAALRCARENVFIGKAMRLRTDFTCKGLVNKTSDDKTNKFFDSVIYRLRLAQIYRNAVWLHNTVGLVPMLLPEEDKPLSFVELLDPRHVRVQEWYGKKYMYLIPDKRMLDALRDPKGTSSPFNKDYYAAMPKDWIAQLKEQAAKNGGAVTEGMLIRLKPGSYIVIENRDGGHNIDRAPGAWDGSPLQPYFSAAETYHTHMAGDFAAGFLSKNMLALVSVGDPKSEGDNYQRPDGGVLSGLQSVLQNPNQAEWIYGDPTLNVRYITPDPDIFNSAKYDEPKEQFKNLLPACYWADDGGDFASSQTAITALQDECDNTNRVFDEEFWLPLFKRASDGRARIAKTDLKAPEHDRNSMQDRASWLTGQSALYSNGGLSIRSLIEAYGHDYEVERERMLAQVKERDAHPGLWAPAWEGKQGILAGMLEKEGVIPSTGPATTSYKGAVGGGASSSPTPKKKRKRKTKPDGKAGPPKKPGARPQSEASRPRTPRPSES